MKLGPSRSTAAKTSTTKKKTAFAPYTKINFIKDVSIPANKLADRIEANFEALAHILLEYESYEVVVDEIERTLDLLRNLDENKGYFKLRVGPVAAFLPRNQPLYAFSCFVIVPALMSSEVHFRIPHSMKHFFPKVLATLNIYEEFPNITVSHATRLDFLKERSALNFNPKKKETLPVTDAVIFTGTSLHAEQLRTVFDQRTLFISNGSGHNPVVISKDADLPAAVEAVLALQLYNQGQDCAAPNAILVHKDVAKDFLRMLRDEIRTIRVGDYRDRKCRVGPISDPKDLVRVADFLIENRQWLDPTTPGGIRAYDATLEPTILVKPLSEGGNYDEIFAPVIFLQEYESDADLKLYFENERYAPNAMYVTVYGSSSYVQDMIGKLMSGKVLHELSSFLANRHLHERGVERGTQPYGGNGHAASSFSINGSTAAKATLPQRDIFEQVARPLLKKGATKKRQALLKQATEVLHKDVQKLLRIIQKESASQEKGEIDIARTYVDSNSLAKDVRFSRLPANRIYTLRATPNAAFIAGLSPDKVKLARLFRTFFAKKQKLSLSELEVELYNFAKVPRAAEAKNKQYQLDFFKLLYQLLFGKDSGPRLAQFLYEADRVSILHLLDI